MAKKNLISIILIILAIAAISFFLWKHNMKNNKPNSVVTGLSDGQEAYFRKELETAFEFAAYIKKGKQLASIGKSDEAIKDFTRALSVAKLSGEKGVARICLANVYEKKRDYKKAFEWIVMVRNQANDWAKRPYTERARYLEYALNGEYELAIAHAEKAIEEYMGVHGDAPVERQDYLTRLNDLIAAKDYILSLKKSEEKQGHVSDK